MTAQIVRHVRAGPPPVIDTRIPHKDWTEAGDDMRVSKREQQDYLPEVDNPTLPQFVVVIALYIGALVGIVAAAKYLVTGSFL